jgi:hypothetical protein
MFLYSIPQDHPGEQKTLAGDREAAKGHPTDEDLTQGARNAARMGDPERVL